MFTTGSPITLPFGKAMMASDAIGVQNAIFPCSATCNAGAGTPGQATAYTCHAFDREVQVDDPLAGIVSTAYDTQGRVTRIVSPQGAINCVYDPATGLKTPTWTGPIADPVSDQSKRGLSRMPFS